VAKETKVGTIMKNPDTRNETKGIGRIRMTGTVCISLLEIVKLLHLALGRCPWRT